MVMVMVVFFFSCHFFYFMSFAVINIQYSEIIIWFKTKKKSLSLQVASNICCVPKRQVMV